MKPASVVLVVLLSAAMASVSAAQTNGVPASVTSFGFSGNRNAAPGIPASVTSLGPRGYGVSQCCPNHFSAPGTYLGPLNGSLPRHHNPGHSNSYGYGYGYGYGYVPIYSYGGYYPGYSPVIVADQDDPQADDTEDSGPTVFEHRGSRRPATEEAYSRGYEEGRADAEDAHAPRRGPHHADADDHAAHKPSDAHSDKPEAKADDDPAPAVVVKTVLVYKDNNRKEEVSNYAIVGDQLFDFTNGRRKIAIADLDIPATTKANDDRGVDFQLPTVHAKK